MMMLVQLLLPRMYNTSDGNSTSCAGQFNMVLEDSFAQRAVRTVGVRNPPRRFFTSSTVNNMPQRPKTAFFSPLRTTTACSDFAVLEAAAWGYSIACRGK